MALTVLDAGVLIGFLDSNDIHHASATTAIAAVHTSGDHGIVPATAYAELLVRPFRQGTARVKVADEALDALGFTVEPVTRAIAKAAAQLRATHRNLRLPDALVIATARAVGATRLVTTDRRWPKFPGLKIDVL